MRLLLWMTVAVSVTTIGLLMTGVPADAHHSSAPFYDDTKSVERGGPHPSDRFSSQLRWNPGS